MGIVTLEEVFMRIKYYKTDDETTIKRIPVKLDSQDKEQLDFDEIQKLHTETHKIEIDKDY